MINANLNIGGHQVRNLRVGAAEHQVYAGSLHIIVDEVKRPGSIPSTDCLRFGADVMNFGHVRVDDGGFGAVQADSALDYLGFKSVDPQSIEDQMMWYG